MKRTVFVWLLVIALAWLMSAPAMAGTALDAIRTRGVLQVGTAGDYQPMSYLDPGTNTYVGFDAALAEDLAAALGVELEYVETSWPTLMEDTLAGEVRPGHLRHHRHGRAEGTGADVRRLP